MFAFLQLSSGTIDMQRGIMLQMIFEIAVFTVDKCNWGMENSTDDVLFI